MESGWIAGSQEPTVCTVFDHAAASGGFSLVGAEGVVVHTGSCVDAGTLETAMRQVRDGLLPILDALGEDGPWLLLEPTAGQGQSLCAGVDDLDPGAGEDRSLLGQGGRRPGLVALVGADDAVDVGGQAPVRLVFYPGEGHGNRRAASRYDYNLRMIRWMEHYLKGPGGDPPPFQPLGRI